VKSKHHREVTMKTQLQTSYIKLITVVAVAAPLAGVLGGGRLI
jgi:hypothetical protein